MKVLVIDVGGSNVKILATGQTEPIKFPSGPDMTPAKMVAGVKKLTADWEYDAVSIGLPGPVLRGQLILDPANLGSGWVGFDFRRAFGVPVKIINDAAMQALGSYKGGKLLFFGLGTGLGTAMVINGVAESREIAHVPYKKGRSLEDYVGVRARKRLGKKKWRKHVEKIVSGFINRVHADDIVLGGGEVKHLKKLPKGARLGNNANAFVGGFRLWEQPVQIRKPGAKVLKIHFEKHERKGGQETRPAPAPSRHKAA
ncbi:MAG TPA: ROK family protein [Candidatus Angelobacter sp.]|nr:ROK family protein [Candidatus Angelobacter sp.]